MKVSVSKSKKQTIYYLSKSVWVDGKSTTKTIEKIGSEEELLKVCGDLTPLEWAKQYAAKRSAEESNPVYATFLQDYLSRIQEVFS